MPAHGFAVYDQRQVPARSRRALEPSALIHRQSKCRILLSLDSQIPATRFPAPDFPEHISNFGVLPPICKGCSHGNPEVAKALRSNTIPFDEILKKYRPDVLWFDDIDMKNDAQVLDLYQTVRQLRPECVINSRIQGCVPPKKIPPPFCDYISSGDDEILTDKINFEWENPGSMNTSYGHNPNDHKWDSAAEIVSKLVQIVSKGGNDLLNVGPTPEGTIPQPCIDRLTEVGRWMDHNGEAIYGSSPWSITEEKHETSGRVIHFTSKGAAVYVFCPVNGKAGNITVKALGADQIPGKRIASIMILGSEDRVQWSQDAKELQLAVPADAPGGIIATYRIELRQ